MFSGAVCAADLVIHRPQRIVEWRTIAMATDAKTEMTAVELLHLYLGRRLQNGDREIPLQQILAEFPDYVRQRESMRGMIREAEEAIAAGRSGPLDLEQTIREVTQDLAAEGISD